MLRSNRRASDIANSFVNDGDDLYITSSFRASEDNSSVAGNASCVGSMGPLFEVSKKEGDYGSTDSAASTVEISQAEARDDEAIDEQAKFKILRQLSFKRRLAQAKTLLPWRLNTFMAYPRQSRAIREYQEMVEPDGSSPTASDAASYAGTVHSIRSSRVNIASGRSMLVRQNAQVINRPSIAQSDWDVGSKLSSFSSSGSSSGDGSARSRMRSLSWDNASYGARSEMSHLTGDSFRSKRSDFTTSRAMYVHPEPFLLGTTDEEDEWETETESENHSPNSMLLDSRERDATAIKSESLVRESSAKFKRAAKTSSSDSIPTEFEHEAGRVVNRLLKKRRDGLNSMDLFEVRSIDDSICSYGEDHQVRARVYSDSDFVFEMHRQRAAMDGCVDEFGFKVPPVSSYEEPPRIERHIDLDFDVDAMRSRSYSDSVISECVWKELDRKDLPPERSRSASESWAGYPDDDSGAGFLQDFDYVRRSSNIDDIEISSFALMTPLHESRKRIAKAASKDADRRASQPLESIPLLDHDHVTSAQKRLSDPETTKRRGAFGLRIPSPTSWRARGAKIGCEDSRDRESYESQGSIETLVARGNTRRKPTGDPRESLQSAQRLSSPTAANAAKMIASALRPPTASTSRPATAVSYNYYWNDGSDGDSIDSTDEVLWALSADDSFEDMF